MAEIELGRGTTPLPAGLEAEGVTEQRCVVKVDDVGYHIEALESLSLPSWKATFTWETVQHLHVEPTEIGAAITIADQSPGNYRVELRNVSADEVSKALARYRSRLTAYCGSSAGISRSAWFFAGLTGIGGFRRNRRRRTSFGCCRRKVDHLGGAPR